MPRTPLPADGPPASAVNAPVPGARIVHHGAVDGVTGSCHQLWLDSANSILIDCGLFQGAETSAEGAGSANPAINFSLAGVRALVVTHVHIDHVGRIPHLIAAGFRGPIYCSEASALLLPLVLEDALRMGISRDSNLIENFLGYIRRQIRPLPCKQWHPVPEVIPPQTGTAMPTAAPALAIRLQRAGHILGSVYVECELTHAPDLPPRYRVLFSGDLGAPHTPLLYAPAPPWGCDELVIESTYGDRRHAQRKERSGALRRSIEAAVRDGGTVLIPAFSIGRTQELLYEIEHIIHGEQQQPANRTSPWHDLPVIVDSPLASRFTAAYQTLQSHWDAEARQRLRRGRHPLSFAQLLTVDTHSDHQKLVANLAHSKRPAVVIAASGMCAGGRIVNYLKAMLEEPRHNILFVGYQARGTAGRTIQESAGRGGSVVLDGARYTINAGVDTISGYSAHADQHDLLGFIKKMRKKPQRVRIVHGDERAKYTLQRLIREQNPATEVQIP